MSTRTRSPLRQAFAELERLQRTRQRLTDAYALKIALIDEDMRRVAIRLHTLIGPPLANGQPPEDAA